MDNKPTVTDEILQVRRALFQDYCNARDRIRDCAKLKIIQLGDTQAKRVLSIARKNYMRREVEKNAAWFKRFTHNVDTYYAGCKLGNWGSFRDR